MWRCRSFSLPSSSRRPPRDENTQKFSHRFHLKETGAECLSCHAAALNSSSATDSLLPLEETCLQCHDGTQARDDCHTCHEDPGRAESFPSPQRDFRFDHEWHLQFGNVAPLLASAIDSGSYLGKSANVRRYLNTANACVACHRGLQEVDFSNPGNLPQMADCLICHTEIEPPFSCSVCHLPDAQIKPASHTSDYLDLHSREEFQLDTPSCKICHGVNFRCMGCH